MDPAIPFIILAVLFVALALSAIRIVPQARAYNIERFGRYIRTLNPGLNFLVPGVDRVNTKFDLREQVFSSRPQPVITEDNLVVNIDTVLYYQITAPKAAAYEVANYIQAIDQLTVTTLRNVIGSMDLERTLTSREEINTPARGPGRDHRQVGDPYKPGRDQGDRPAAHHQGGDGEADAGRPRQAGGDPARRG